MVGNGGVSLEIVGNTWEWCGMMRIGRGWWGMVGNGLKWLGNGGNGDEWWGMVKNV